MNRTFSVVKKPIVPKGKKIVTIGKCRLEILQAAIDTLEGSALMVVNKLKRQWRGLVAFYRGHPARLGGALVFTSLSAILSLLLPLVIQFTVDSILDTKAPSLPSPLAALFTSLGGRPYLVRNLWLMGLAILLITMVDVIFTFYRGKWVGIFAESGARTMRQTLYDHIQNLPFDYHVQAETGDLIQRCTSDVEAITRFFSTQLMEIIRSLTLIVFSVYIMFQFDMRMALIAIAVSPVIFLTSVLYFRKERDAFQKWDEAEGALSATLQENLTGIRVVKAFARQSYERCKFAKKNGDLLEHGWKTFRVIANFWMFSDFICLFQIGAVTVFGTLAVISGRISLGSLVVFISYTEMLLYPLRGLARILADAGKMQISNSRLQEILNEPTEPDDSGLLDPKLSGGITFDHVDFRYGDDQRPVLQEITLVIQPGETIGLIGPTGSGKSTLLYLLQRLYEPSGGRILLDGTDIRDIKRSSVRRQIGLILQEPFVFSRSVFENIRLPRPKAEAEDVYAASRIAAFHDDVLSFSDKYETMVGERGVTLSGGQKQRLTIARTLIRECPVVIFDDSLSAVDTRTDQQIRQELRARRNQSTTLLVSHRIATLAEADRILVLENGRITASGTHQDLIRTPGLYKRVYDIQNSLDLAEEGEGS
jgi:ATP-binding cassette, subfamily B, bacterial